MQFKKGCEIEASGYRAGGEEITGKLQYCTETLSHSLCLSGICEKMP